MKTVEEYSFRSIQSPQRGHIHFEGRDDGFDADFARIASSVALRLAAGVKSAELFVVVFVTVFADEVLFVVTVEGFKVVKTGAFDVFRNSSILFFFLA